MRPRRAQPPEQESKRSTGDPEKPAAWRVGAVPSSLRAIFIYAIFTGLAAASRTWWELAIFRFLTALGIGGEWAAGAALVAEIWPEEKRARAAGLLQSAWAAGFFLAALVHLGLAAYSWRVVFLVGILPAAVAVLMRYGVKEPERWSMAIYLPELYPTRIRATGVAFCFNAGRVLASASPRS